MEVNTGRIIKEILIDDFRMNNRKGLYSYIQKIMAYNSNKIEGSRLTSEQTASLFDTGTIVSNGVEVYKSKDIEEMNGHFKMFNECLKHIDEPLTQDLIKSYHYQLKNGVFEDFANGYAVGDYKTLPNVVSDIITTAPGDVENAMSELLNWYDNSDKSLRAIAEFHSRYERIHPFQDGNGRTGRMIIFKQCLDCEITPVIVLDEEKPLYMRALHEASDRNLSVLEDYFSSCQQRLEKDIEVFISN
jgi:Fic family protein